MNDFKAEDVLEAARENYPHINFDLNLVRQFMARNSGLIVFSMAGLLDKLVDWVLANDLAEVTP